jgi:hypothetical protein
MIIALPCSSVRAQDATLPMSNMEQAATTIRPQTLKERLGDKASDEQRVDNCNVPPERRGMKIRQDGCEHEITAPSVVNPK